MFPHGTTDSVRISEWIVHHADSLSVATVGSVSQLNELNKDCAGRPTRRYAYHTYGVLSVWWVWDPTSRSLDRQQTVYELPTVYPLYCMADGGVGLWRPLLYKIDGFVVKTERVMFN